MVPGLAGRSQRFAAATKRGTFLVMPDPRLRELRAELRAAVAQQERLTRSLTDVRAAEKQAAYHAARAGRGVRLDNAALAARRTGSREEQQLKAARARVTSLAGMVTEQDRRVQELRDLIRERREELRALKEQVS